MRDKPITIIRRDEAIEGAFYASKEAIHYLYIKFIRKYKLGMPKGKRDFGLEVELEMERHQQLLKEFPLKEGQAPCSQEHFFCLFLKQQGVEACNFEIFSRPQDLTGW